MKRRSVWPDLPLAGLLLIAVWQSSVPMILAAGVLVLWRISDTLDRGARD